MPEWGKRFYSDLPKNPDGTVNAIDLAQNNKQHIPLPDDHPLNQLLKRNNDNHETVSDQVPTEASTQISYDHKDATQTPKTRTLFFPSGQRTAADSVLARREEVEAYLNDPQNKYKDTQHYIRERYGENAYNDLFPRPYQWPKNPLGFETVIALPPRIAKLGHEGLASGVHAVRKLQTRMVKSINSGIVAFFSTPPLLFQIPLKRDNLSNAPYEMQKQREQKHTLHRHGAIEEPSILEITKSVANGRHPQQYPQFNLTPNGGRVREERSTPDELLM